MDGIFISGRRPKSKKEVKEHVKVSPTSVRIECTSVFGGGYDGTVADAPPGRYGFVGPDPYSDRKFYGTIAKGPLGKTRVL